MHLMKCNIIENKDRFSFKVNCNLKKISLQLETTSQVSIVDNVIIDLQISHAILVNIISHCFLDVKPPAK